MTTYYHVADPAYTPGEDLECYYALEARGVSIDWKWDGAEPGFDGDKVSLFRSLEEAVAMQEEMGGCIMQVTLPDRDTDGEIYHLDRRIDTGINAEGYAFVYDRIPGEWVQPVLC